MANGYVGSGGVVNRVITTSGEAWHVNAKYGVGGRYTRTGYALVPPLPSHIITETTTAIINAEDSKQFITEST